MSAADTDTRPHRMTERERLVDALLRVNPFGGYCARPCKHPAHTNAVYRATLKRYGVNVK